MPTQEQVDAYLPPLRAAPGARPGRAGVDRRHGRPGGLHRGALPGARQADAGAGADPAAGAEEFRAAVRPRLAAGCCTPTAPRTPTPSWWRWARCSAPSRTRWTKCATTGTKIGVLGITCFRPFPLAAVRAALSRRQARRGAGEEPRRRARRHRLAQRAHLAARAARMPVYTVIAGLGGRAITALRCARCSATAIAGQARAADLPRPRPRRRRPRARARARAAPLRPDRREHAARHGRRRRPRRVEGDAPCPSNRSSSTRPAPSPSATACSTRSERSVQANMRRTNSLNSGHRACQGCGEALGARYAIDAAMEATGNQLIAANATGCLEVFSTPYPETSWQIPWIHSLFGNTAAVATGIAAALRVKGRTRRARGRPGRRRRHHRHRLRLPVGHVRAQRRRALHLLRQRGLHEHRRAALLGHAAGGAHRHHHGGRRPSPATSSARARTCR